ncbi:hypothetical protein GCM10023189_27890 [Nibrella saemangeumensis]|uniref:Acetoacetate decarboxylase n=1 Tax=Nibrella saemangeumensis TaxID=1084526 RepID=A0ABP8MWK9_9BACT
MPIIPPPWSLTGNGLVLIYHFPEAFVRNHGFLAGYQRLTYKGWLGAVILADYDTSGVGPYRELLFMPGLFGFGRRRSFSISKIYVSTQDSVESGIANWGIPKELADFEIVHTPDGSTLYRVSRGRHLFFQLRVRSWGPEFPVTTKLIPRLGVIQQRDRDLLFTHLTASGKARLASRKSMLIDPVYFPDFSQIRPLAILSIQGFSMTFPVPELV